MSDIVDVLAATESATPVQEVTLSVPDISCGHCERTIRDELGALAGVVVVTPSLASKEVTVVFAPAELSLEQITRTLAEAGYPVVS